MSRAWRAAASDPALFRVVDLSTGSGVDRVNDGLLHAISAKARGLLRSLDVTGRVKPACRFFRERVSVDALARVVGDNAASLQHLRALCTLDEQGEGRHELTQKEVCRLQQASATTTRFDVDVKCTSTEDLLALLRTGTSSSVFVRFLKLELPYKEWEDETFTDVQAYLAAHPSVMQLSMWQAPLGATREVNELVECIVASRLTSLTFVNCGMDAASMPALTHLSSEGSLRVLCLVNNGIEVPPSSAFCSALHSCELVKLTHTLGPVGAIAIVNAVTGHHTLQVISFTLRPLNMYDLDRIRHSRRWCRAGQVDQGRCAIIDFA